MTRVAGTPTIGLRLAPVLNAVSTGRHLVFDSRLGSLVAALIALPLKAPLLVVVIVEVLAAALPQAATLQ